MNKIIGFIGCGNMAKAMIGGIMKAKLVSPNQLIVSNRSEPSLKEVKELYDVMTTLDNKEVTKHADILFLAVKPYLYQQVIEEIKAFIKEDVIIINIAAGVTLEQTVKMFGKELKVVKTMPNTPSLVLEGMSAISPNHLITNSELQAIITIFESFGQAEVVEEKMMDAVTAVSGSSPAYIYMLIEAMADGAVLQGMPRNQAYKFASQAVLGAAKMVLETGIHPGQLKDQVCSPGGTTIEAVATLEKEGFRNAVIQAMKACSDKSKWMSK